jgi:hypothetical protein
VDVGVIVLDGQLKFSGQNVDLGDTVLHCQFQSSRPNIGLWVIVLDS